MSSNKDVALPLAAVTQRQVAALWIPAEVEELLKELVLVRGIMRVKSKFNSTFQLLPLLINKGPILSQLVMHPAVRNQQRRFINFSNENLLKSVLLFVVLFVKSL